MLDGVFTHTGDGTIEFREASELLTDHVRQVESALQRRVLRYFRRHGLLDEPAAAGMLTWQGSGGFSVDASVRIEGEDRAGIERDHLPSASGAPLLCSPALRARTTARPRLHSRPGITREPPPLPLPKT